MVASSANLSALTTPSGAIKFKTDFDPHDLELRPTFSERLAVMFLRNPGIFRWLFPIVRVPGSGYVLVTRCDDVREVMARHNVFQMGLADRMRLLTGGPNFVLAMDNEAEHDKILRHLMKAFRREDAANIVAPFCARMSETIVRDSHGRLDIMQDLVTRVPALLCERYFGIRIDEESRVAFTHWTFAISQYLFLGLTEVPRYRRAALAGAERIRALIDTAIADAKQQRAQRHAMAARRVAMASAAATGPTYRSIRWSESVEVSETIERDGTVEVRLRREEMRVEARPSAEGCPFGDTAGAGTLAHAALSNTAHGAAAGGTVFGGMSTRPRHDTVLGRLIEMQATAPELTDDVIRACLMGTISGFVPTNTLTAGHLLQYVLKHEKVKSEARAAAQAGCAAAKVARVAARAVHNAQTQEELTARQKAQTEADKAQAEADEKLRRILFEASRFEPTLVGRFRVCAQDTAIAVGTARETEIKRGERLLISTLSAMFDSRRIKNPRTFNLDRDRTDYLSFGHGLHTCLGLHIAEAQITQTLKPLLAKSDLRPARGSAGRLKHIGNFPEHWIMEFEAD